MGILQRIPNKNPQRHTTEHTLRDLMEIPRFAYRACPLLQMFDVTRFPLDHSGVRVQPPFRRSETISRDKETRDRAESDW